MNHNQRQYVAPTSQPTYSSGWNPPNSQPVVTYQAQSYTGYYQQQASYNRPAPPPHSTAYPPPPQLQQAPPTRPPPLSLPPSDDQTELYETCVYVGLEDAPPEFRLAFRVIGEKGQNLEYLSRTTGAKVILRGRGTGLSNNKPLHIYVGHSTLEGKEEAESLANNLVRAVKDEFMDWKKTRNIDIKAAMVPPPVLNRSIDNKPLGPKDKEKRQLTITRGPVGREEGRIEDRRVVQIQRPDSAMNRLGPEIIISSSSDLVRREKQDAPSLRQSTAPMLDDSRSRRRDVTPPGRGRRRSLSPINRYPDDISRHRSRSPYSRRSPERRRSTSRERHRPGDNDRNRSQHRRNDWSRDSKPGRDERQKADSYLRDRRDDRYRDERDGDRYNHRDNHNERDGDRYNHRDNHNDPFAERGRFRHERDEERSRDQNFDPPHRHEEDRFRRDERRERFGEERRNSRDDRREEQYVEPRYRDDYRGRDYDRAPSPAHSGSHHDEEVPDSDMFGHAYKQAQKMHKKAERREAHEKEVSGRGERFFIPGMRGKQLQQALDTKDFSRLVPIFVVKKLTGPIARKSNSIWVIGDMFAYLACQSAADHPNGPNLGIPRTMVFWFAFPEITVVSAARCVEEKMVRNLPPDAIVLHLGANDLPKYINNFKSLEKDMSKMMKDISRLLPKTHISWSNILPWRKYPTKDDNNKILEVRDKMNSIAKKLMKEYKGSTLFHDHDFPMQRLDGVESFQQNGYYPTEEGARSMVHNFETIIKDLVSEPSTN